MALVYDTGFEEFSNQADLLKDGWASISGGVTISTATFRPGGHSARAYQNATSNAVSYTLPSNSTTWYLEFAALTTSGANMAVMQMRDGSSQQNSIVFNVATGKVQLRRGDHNGTVLAESTNVFSLGGNWFDLAVKAVTSNSTGAAYLVYVNGNLEISYASGNDTANTANSYANAVGFGSASGGNVFIDDLVISDSALLLTRPHVVYLLPDGNGNESDFVGSDGNSTNNYDLVNDTLIQSTNYTQSGTVNDNDLYTLANLGYTPDVIHAVTVSNYLWKNGAGARQLRNLIRTGGVDYESAIINPSATPIIYNTNYELNPGTAAAWTPTEVNALEIGVNVES